MAVNTWTFVQIWSFSIVVVFYCILAVYKRYWNAPKQIYMDKRYWNIQSHIEILSVFIYFDMGL